ncbi:MAG: hypothetical protein AB1726_15710 [Planctomycetota bacterium]
MRAFGGAMLVAAFLAAIWLPLADALLGIAPVIPLVEKRLPAPRPAFPADRASLAALPAALEAYHDDRFGFRAALIRLHHLLLVRGLRMAPSEDVVLGKDGWLFLGLQGAIDQHRAVDPLPAEVLAAWQRRLEECHEYCEDRGALFLFVIAPNKLSIYPEHLPDSVRRVGKETRLDQFLRHMGERSRVPILDLRPALLEAKRRELVYRKYDAHWNEVGAFAAYRGIVQELRRTFPAIPLYGEADFRRRVVTAAGGDLADIVGLPDLYAEDIVVLDLASPPPMRPVVEGMIRASIPWKEGNIDRLMAGERTAPFGSEIDDPALPRLVMIRDSFATNVLGYLSTGFCRAVYYWQYFVDPEILLHERPDIVVQQVIERVLLQSHLPPNPPKLVIDFERRRRFRASSDVRFVLPAPGARSIAAAPPASFDPAAGAVVVAAPGGERLAVHVPAPTGARADAGAILRLAVDADGPLECGLAFVSDAAPAEDGLPLATRTLSAGREIVYFAVGAGDPAGGDPLAPGRHLRIELSGAAAIASLDLEIRGAGPAR